MVVGIIAEFSTTCSSRFFVQPKMWVSDLDGFKPFGHLDILKAE